MHIYDCLHCCLSFSTCNNSLVVCGGGLTVFRLFVVGVGRVGEKNIKWIFIVVRNFSIKLNCVEEIKEQADGLKFHLILRMAKERGKKNSTGSSLQILGKPTVLLKKK